MAPPAKRKREEDEEGRGGDEAPVSSKKSKLEEAKRRAREWGLQEKKKMEAAKAKRENIELSTLPTDSLSSEAKPKKPSMKASRTTPAKKSTANSTMAAPAIVTSTPIAPPPPPGSAPAADPSVGAPLVPAAPSSAVSTPVISATPANTPVPSIFPGNSYTAGPVNADFMAHFMMTQQANGAFPQTPYPPTMAAAPSSAAIYTGYNPYSAALLQQQLALQMAGAQAQAFPSATISVSKASPKSAPSQALESHSVAVSSRTVTIENRPKRETTTGESDDEAMPQPPVTTLEMQISQQVLANASASLKNQPAPYTEAPPEAFSATASPEDDEHSLQYEHDDQPIIVDIEESESIEPTVKQPSFLPWLFFVVAMALMISVFYADDPSKSPIIIIESNNKAIDVPCFQDSEPRYLETQEGEEVRRELIQPCATVESIATCPSLAFCQDGKLLHCTHKGFQVDPTATKCELTPAILLDTVALWMTALEESTIADFCIAGGSHAELPLFDYQKLQLTYPITLATHPLDNAVMQTAFAVQESDGRLFIGLPDDHLVTIPLRCRFAHSFRKFLKVSLEWIGLFCWKLIAVCTKVAWSMMSAYPLMSLIGLITMAIVHEARSFQKRRIHLVKDVARMRDMAFDKLQDQSDTAHALLHLRDDIVATLTADQDVLQGARQQRQHWITEVWPRVVPQLQQDNRIKKTQRVEVGGKRRDYWQWVAAKSASKKRVGIVEGIKKTQ